MSSAIDKKIVFTHSLIMTWLLNGVESDQTILFQDLKKVGVFLKSFTKEHFGNMVDKHLPIVLISNSVEFELVQNLNKLKCIVERRQG